MHEKIEDPNQYIIKIKLKKTLYILQNFAIKIFWRREENLLQRKKKKTSKKTIEELIDTIPVQKDNRAPKTSRKKLSNRKEKKKTKNQERRVESMEEIWKKARWVLREKEMKIIIKLGPNKMGFFCYNGTKT